MSVFRNIKSFFFGSDPVIITPYGGYANDKTLHALARVLEDKNTRVSEQDSKLRNLWNSFKRLESDEKASEKVIVKWSNGQQTLISDNEGYVTLNRPYEPAFNDADNAWIPLTYQLIQNDEVSFETTSTILKPGENIEFGVISDLDDTILITGVTSFLKWRLVINSLFRGSHSRKAFDGAAHFYQSLKKGSSGKADNPFFYLSNSPWNLFEYLNNFLSRNEFPKGVLLMRDFGLEHWRKKTLVQKNKYLKVKHLLETYPNMKFILIGDAGEHDTDIYLSIAKEFPSRILAIYIRSVSSKSRIARIERLIENETDVEVSIINHNDEALSHARENGFIQ